MNILVVAAHPDDEVLGCGGAIAKHSQQGDIVNILILAEGATSRATSRNPEQWQFELSALAIAAKETSRFLGAKAVDLHNFPDNRMDSCDLLDIVKVIEAAIQKFQPTVVYTHHSGDVNIDLRRIHDAVIAACRPQPHHPVKTLLFFEVPSSTEWQPPGSAPAFAPNWFVDISTTLADKVDALTVYESELRSWPHPRSIEAVKHLAHWRGATIGVSAAEAFIVGRAIV